MEMGTKAIACVICQPDKFACNDYFILADLGFFQMGVGCLVAVLVADAHVDAVIMLGSKAVYFGDSASGNGIDSAAGVLGRLGSSSVTAVLAT